MSTSGNLRTWIAVFAVMAAVFGSLVYSSANDGLTYVRVDQAHIPAFWE